jgi:hypothetical protein
MDAVLGIGKAGCAIADVMANYPQYEIFKIDVGLEKSKNTYPMPEQPTSQAYEESCPDFTSFFDSFGEEDNVMVALAGGGAISGATLKILEKIKHTKITLLYIKPDISLIGGKKFLYDDMTFHVLQEYARSGLFESICLVHNPTIEDIMGNVPVKGYYDVLNKIIVTTIHMINVYNNTESEFQDMSDSEIQNRICSIGLFDVGSSEEKLFFPLDNIKEKVYYVGATEKSLEDHNFFRQLKGKFKNNSDDDDIRVSYMIHETKFNEDYVYILAKSDEIQYMEK